MPRLILAALAAVCLLFTACDDDPAEPEATSSYKDLSEEGHVLFNLEKAYDQRNIDRYAELFADNFVFSFNAGDIGGIVPARWCRAEEILSAHNMFTGAGGIENNPISSIDLTLFDLGTIQWEDVTDHPDFPGETLRKAIVTYDYFIDTVQDRQFITSGAPQAEFTVREIDGKWKIVDWYDFADGFQLSAASATEESNWSRVKALYRGELDYTDLCEEWQVLHNLEQAYDDKNIDRYVELFDPGNFVFFFDPGDVGGHIPPSGQWGYAEEIQSATNMFNSAGGIENNPILTIDLTLFNIEQVQWIEVTTPDFPGEVLRMSTVVYDFFIDTVDDRQFITSGGPAAQFIVRKIDRRWKLVQWFDLGSDIASVARVSTESTNWGRIKALYQ